jgi:beta-hydroxyacyl-ACP dehydratase FabZ
VSIDIPAVLERLSYRYPSLLVDSVETYEPGHRVVAAKNVTIGEEYFQGHFPGTPLMPGVLMIETLAQVATILLLHEDAGGSRTFLRGVENAKFRRQVVPGDRLQLEVTLDRRRTGLARTQAIARVGDQVVAEMDLLLGLEGRPADIHPTAIVHSAARIGEGTVVGPHAVIGEHVRIGRNCNVGPSSVIDGWTEIGDECHIFPMASVGLIPQDLKFKGEQSRTVIGRRNVFREFVTVHRGTAGGGGLTSIGDGNLFMAYVHIAHDCHVGSHTIFANAATLGGHVVVGAPVLPDRAARVHRRCLGHHEGRAAVREDRWEPPGARVRREHDWPRPARVPAGRHREDQAGVPPAASVEAEHEQGAGEDRNRSHARLRRGAISRRVHPKLDARRHPAQARPPR